MAITPTIRCPRCEHPIDSHTAPVDRTGGACGHTQCNCRMSPNTIAVAAIQEALYGELTKP